MTGKEQLLEKLRAEKQATQAANGVDWDTQRQEWIASINELLTQLKGWMATAVGEGLLSVEDTSHDMTEEHLGTYIAPGLRISTPAGRKVDVRPHARVIIGGLGRVDLVSGPSRSMLIRDESGDWKLAARGGPGLKTAPLTEETFSETLTWILN